MYNPWHLYKLIEHSVNLMPQSQSYIIHYDAAIVANTHSHNVEQMEASTFPYIITPKWSSLRDSLVNLMNHKMGISITPQSSEYDTCQQCGL